MPHVGNDNEPLLDRLAFAFDGTFYKPLRLDSDGYLRTSEQHPLTSIAATVSNWPDTQQVSLAADQNLQARQYGYVGTAWQKQPLQFGYGGVFSDHITNNDLAGGDNLIYGAVAPNNRVWVVKNISVGYTGTTTNVQLQVQVRVLGWDNIVFYIKQPTSGAPYPVNGEWVLSPGDRVVTYIQGATAHDDFFQNACGYYFDINL